MNKLKLEAGKFYRVSRGEKAKLLEKMGDRWIGVVLGDDNLWWTHWWNKKGKLYGIKEPRYLDLTAEWTEDDNWEDVDLTKITLAMLPLEARFRNDVTEEWILSNFCGTWLTAGRYLCSNYEWWKHCEVKKGQQ